MLQTLATSNQTPVEKTTRLLKQDITNNQPGYGCQLYDILVGRVSANTPPVITAFNYSSTSISFSGTHGMAGGTYRILATTDVVDPLATGFPA